MHYCFQLLPHPNIHYAQALRTLGANELTCMLQALGCNAPVSVETIGGADFFAFEAEELSPAQLNALAGHSSLLLMAAREGELLRPLPVQRADYLPRELAEVLKYKGKTSATFTRMMINCALAAAGLTGTTKPVTVLDPICGRATSCFCALEMGMNAVGVDMDRNDLREAMNYFSRYCTMRKLKHGLKQASETCGKHAVPTATYTLADTKEHYAAGDTRTLRLYHADTTLTGTLLRKHPADILVADLPYGVQHAPQDGKKTDGFQRMLSRALPAWKQAVKKGGAVAVSFNVLTLPRQKLAQLMEEAGFRVLTEPCWADNEHFVEQAVRRDLIIALHE